MIALAGLAAMIGTALAIAAARRYRWRRARHLSRAQARTLRQFTR